MNKHKVYFYSPNRIEPWDYRNVFDVGIGGSETSHVEMATRLAKRGHEVISYTDLPSDCPDRDFMGVTWKHLNEAQFDSDGLWIVYRSPATGQVMREHNLRAWLICQDVFYPNWKSEDVSAFEYVFGLCPRHIKEISHNDPANADKVRLTANGVNAEDIRALHALNLPRNEKRLIWSSSPDRGLKELLDIFEIAYREDPQLTLDVYYGMDNIDKICGGDRNKYPWSESWKQYDRCHELPGVTWRGRVGQKQLRKVLCQSGIWCYCTHFSETFCVSATENQACGTIPITNPIWATQYVVRHGVFIEGQPNDPLIRLRYAQAIVRLANSSELQAKIRETMIPDSLQRWSWENVVDQWENLF